MNITAILFVGFLIVGIFVVFIYSNGLRGIMRYFLLMERKEEQKDNSLLKRRRKT